MAPALRRQGLLRWRVTLRLPVPASGFHLNPGAYPDQIPPGTKLIVQFANGYIDDKHEYEPRQLRWSLTGHAWDVAAVAIAGTVVVSEGRQANGTYA